MNSLNRSNKPTPSVLKWLAENRARTAHDLLVSEALLAELSKKVDKLRRELSALEGSIKIYDPSINPESIEPINGWKGNYGKRGALKNYILEVIREQSPHWVATDLIRMKVMERFGIVFTLPKEDRAWRAGSFRGALKKLLYDGLIEREHDPELRTVEMGRWRLKTEDVTLASLARKESASSDC